MARALDLVVLGDCNPDLVLADPELAPTFGQAEQLVDDATLTIGGSGAIMACAAARLGLRTALVAVVGDDLFGRFMIDALGERGVETRAIIIDPALRTGLTVILARPDDRAILTFPGAIAALSAERIDPDLLSRTRHVHVSSFYLQTALASGLGTLLSTARDAGAVTSIDPNWDPTGRWDGGLRELLPVIDVLLPNAVEVCEIAAETNPRRAAETLARRGPLVAVKLGAGGALAVPGGALAGAGGARAVTARAPAGVTAIDAVGAGDTFDAGFIAGRLAGESIASALALACACGTLSTRAAGGTEAQPTLEEARAARVTEASD